MFRGGTVIDVRYRDEIPDLYVHTYSGAIGNDFIQIDDDTKPQSSDI